MNLFKKLRRVVTGKIIENSVVKQTIFRLLSLTEKDSSLKQRSQSYKDIKYLNEYYINTIVLD